VVEKQVLCRDRVRKLPEQFSWVDQRLVRHEHVRRCDCQGLALYLMLVTVGDAEGLSYYSDEKAAALLGLNGAELMVARRQLLDADLIDYRRPIYQVLSLPVLLPRGGAA
jgi:hypothetical protein